MLEGSVLESIYVKDRPKRQNTRWTVAYTTTLLICLAGSIYFYINISPVYKHVDKGFLDNLENCPEDKGPSRNLLDHLNQDQDGPSKATVQFMQVATPWLAASAALSLAIGVVFVQLVRKHAYVMMHLAIVLQVLLYTSISVYLFATGVIVMGLAMLLLVGATVYCVYMFRSRLKLVGQLLSVAANGLHFNPWLFPVAVTLLAVFCLFVLAMAIFIAFAWMNGSVKTTDFMVVEDGQCWWFIGDDTKALSQVPCCVWQKDTFASVYIAYVSIFIVWTGFLFSQIRSFVIAGSITQWYFQTNGAYVSASKGTTIRSLGHALTTSFGSLCYSSTVLFFVSVLRSGLEAVRTNSCLAIIYCLLAAWIDFSYALLEIFTKFSTVQMAITGQSFVIACQDVTVLLARNALSAISTWWLPPMVINMCALTISVAWGLVMAAISASVLTDQTSKLAKNGVFIGCVSALMCWYLLMYLGSLLIQITNTVFVCYAWDNEINQVTHQDVHDVFKAVPNGTLIVQPDEHLAYGTGVSRHVPRDEDEPLLDRSYASSDVDTSFFPKE